MKADAEGFRQRGESGFEPSLPVATEVADEGRER